MVNCFPARSLRTPAVIATSETSDDFGLSSPPTPSPPAEKATARQDQTGQASTGDGAGNGGTSIKLRKLPGTSQQPSLAQVYLPKRRRLRPLRRRKGGQCAVRCWRISPIPLSATLKTNRQVCAAQPADRSGFSGGPPRRYASQSFQKSRKRVGESSV
jgi:hypothetical protein